MKKQKSSSTQTEISTTVGIIIIVTVAVILFGGIFVYQCQYQYYNNQVSSPKIASGETYTNNEYGFKLKLPNPWKGYSVEKSSWQGYLVGDYSKKYDGVKIILKNPQSTTEQSWQDIPIMIFTPDVWKLVEEDTIAVSAAPIGPNKIGQNQKFIFANPPRWYGFTDAIGTQEALDIVKTFEAFN